MDLGAAMEMPSKAGHHALGRIAALCCLLVNSKSQARKEQNEKEKNETNTPSEFPSCSSSFGLLLCVFRHWAHIRPISLCCVLWLTLNPKPKTPKP